MLRVLWLVLSTIVLNVMLSGTAWAANVNFNGAFVSNNCPLTGSTYNCTGAFIGSSDIAVIASGITVVVNGGIDLEWAQGIAMSGTARLETTGSNGIKLSRAEPKNIVVTGGTIKAGNIARDANGNLSGGGTFQTAGGRSMTADIMANTIADISATTIRGKLTAVSVTLGSSATIIGAIDSDSLKTDNGAVLDAVITVRNKVEFGSNLNLSGSVTADTITTVSTTTINATVTARTSFTLASGSTVTGDIKAPTVVLNPSGSTVNGNINASTLLDIGSGNTVNGDVDADRVLTKASDAKINGNALVNYLYLNWGASVSKVVTCKVSGTSACSCVENVASYNYKPTCAAAPPPAGAHHFQITHSGSALTCQPRTVTVTACANANCTAPHFTDSSSTVTLQPGNKSFTFTGTTSSATVEQTTAGTATLAATNTTGTVCVNSANASAGNQCTMSFEDTGLQVTADNHIAATTANVRIQALAASANKQSCVPLVASKSENINLSCGFANPASGKARATAQVSVNGTGLTCGNSATKVLLAFDSAGIANATLTYPEVGEVSLDAAYAGSASYTAKGSGRFIAAPARFTIEATSASGAKVAAGSAVSASSAVFAKAGETFTLKISAVNSKGEVTTNFGKETTPENMKLATPVVDNPADAGNAGNITAGAWSTITDGVSSSKTDSTGAWRFSDVGIIRLDVGLDSGVGYLGVAGADFKTAGTQKIGRFTPDHFDTSLPLLATPNGARTRDTVPAGQLAGMTMPCKASATSTALLLPCDKVFVYSYQPFYVIVKAYNSSNNLTSNYQGALAKPITLSAVTTLGGATLVDANVGAMGGSIAGTAPAFTFVGGIGKVEDPNYNLPSTLSVPVFRFKAPPSATTGTNPLQFFLRAADTTDGTTSRRATASDSVETAISAVSGRLVVPNVDGSPSSSMPVTLQAQFYDATRGFMLNPMYNSPARSLATYLRFNNCQKGLANVCATAAQLQLVAPGTAAFQSGKAVFRLSPPTGQYGLGSVELTVEPQWIDYLPSTTGKLTFGLYRSGPIIYTREVY